MKNYRCVTSVQEIQQYIGDAAVVAFDYETAPDEPYRMEEKAALDPQKNHIDRMQFFCQRAYRNICPSGSQSRRKYRTDMLFCNFCELFSRTSVSLKLLTILPLNLQYPVNGIS